MDLRDYMTQKFQSFGIQLSEADLLDVALTSGVELNDTVDKKNKDAVSVGIALLIPSLLLRPTSVSESGFSMSWDVGGLKQYYAYLCRRYGLKNELDTNKPTITFLQ